MTRRRPCRRRDPVSYSSAIATPPDQQRFGALGQFTSARSRWRLIQAAMLVAGLVGIAVVVTQTVDAGKEQVLPSGPALLAAGALALIALASAARSWGALFQSVLRSRRERSLLRGTFYLSQLTKYLPAGGVIQTAGQLGLARSLGISLARSAAAFPVSVVGVAVACATLGSVLALDGDLRPELRVACALGLISLGLLDRRVLAGGVALVRRVVRWVPAPDLLPTQREIMVLYGWALAAVGGYAAAYAVLLRSLDVELNPLFVIGAFAISWIIGFLAVPFPAGVGVREGALLILLPGVGAAPVLAASLALRLLAIATEVLAVGVNRLLARRLRDDAPHGSAASSP